MPPPLPSTHRGMTANPSKPVRRYRPGKPIAEEHSSSEEEEEEEEDENEKAREQERRRQEEARRRQQRQQAPKATSFPAAAATGKGITRGVRNVTIEEENENEEGFVTEEEEEEEQKERKPQRPNLAPLAAGDVAPMADEEEGGEDKEEEEEEEEESSEEESSSVEEAPRRVLLRPTFIRKDQRNNAKTENTESAVAGANTAAEAESRKSQRQEKADMLVRDQLEKDAVARSTANRAWDDEELGEVGEEGAIDDRDELDPEAEHAAWKLRELKRVKRDRETLVAAEKGREEVERRRNLTAEEREREDSEFLAKQKEERDSTHGQTGFMQRYFHKGAFYRDDLERSGLDKRNIMGRKFVDDVSRETLPQYMQVRDMTQLGKKGRTRYRDLRTEDTGRFGEGFDSYKFRGGGRRDAPLGVTDERSLPDRPDDRRSKGPTGANTSAIRDRRRPSRSRSPPSRRRSRSRSLDRRRDSSKDRYRPEGSSRRKRSPSPHQDHEKRRRVHAVS